MERFLATHEELTKEARAFVQKLEPRSTGATLVTLSGELGAGKTSFAQGIAKAYGIAETVTSPTFVLEKIYAIPHGRFSRLVHIDAYRLTGGEELHALGFDEIMGDPKTVVVLEWPEKVTDVLPAPAHRIKLTVVDEGGRSIVYA
tara:strand:+ start:497139 stop:497573 length:435 start_codon:yes stop_codon:yes gene_type:complete